MQNVCNGGYEHFKTNNQQEKMKLHEILSKFHVGHDQIGATVNNYEQNKKSLQSAKISHIAFSTPHNYELHNSNKINQGMTRKRARSTITNN